MASMAFMCRLSPHRWSSTLVGEVLVDLPFPVAVGRAPEWPTQRFVDEALADPAWEPMPFTEYIVKIESRCNLSCDYCYVYEMADQSWRDKPTVMTRPTMDRFADRLGEHLAAHAESVPAVRIVMHGGEPLLAGAERIGYAAAAFRAAAPEGTEVTLAMQTNGVLLDEATLPVLREHDIRLGVSLDGSRASHDKHRKYANGKGSFDAVLRGMDALRHPRYADLFQSVLCTIDVTSDPIEVYEALLSTGSPTLHFLLPHANWSERPPGWAGEEGGTPFADWLIPLFDRWYGTTPVPVRIRLFDEIIALLLGGESRTEGLGLTPIRVLTVDTDGALDLAHTLKSSYAGAMATGMNVFRDSFDQAMTLPGIVARQRDPIGLCDTCRRCPVVKVCGAGNYTHRYRRGSGYLNPSVYCADLARLIAHVGERVLLDVREAAGAQGPSSPELP
ncbi:FxsB family cyclophane-forming radical SAM/SPASM peptide maturase [Streptomyces sp. NPDC002564]|uniref:FxsB family cyclophane-forming radical SAM/SPASM peptide maturase n=1 Tax=Streptomyces sp. NPDC002564 TaxID=3364649 RepID=UPI0036ACE6E9